MEPVARERRMGPRLALIAVAISFSILFFSGNFSNGLKISISRVQNPRPMTARMNQRSGPLPLTMNGRSQQANLFKFNPKNSIRNANVECLASGEMSLEASSSSEGAEVPVEAQKVQKPISRKWEVDLYSRPVIKGGKKLWEFMICDETGGFRYIESVSPDKVNSKQVTKLIEKAIEMAPVAPLEIRFFRKQAAQIILKAVQSMESEINIRPVKSRSTYALFDWLQERAINVYPRMEGYKIPAKKQTSGQFQYTKPAIDLPDYLRADDWTFCEVELREIMANTEDMTEPGRVCEIPESLSPDTLVPGLVIFSNRARALATSLKGSSAKEGDLSSVSIDNDREEVVYDIGVEEKWRVGKLDDERLLREADSFEAKKAELGGLHFLAVQQLPQIGFMDLLLQRQKKVEDEEIEGFWLMRQGNLGWDERTFQ